MSTYKTTAIIIKAKDFGEADRLLTLYSRDYGKISAKAIGIRKITSKLSGHLDLLNLTELMLAKGRSIDTIIGAVIKKSFITLKKDLKKVSLAYYLLELTEKLTPEREKHEEIFDLLKESLGLLEKAEEKSDQELLKAIFEFKLLDELGHRPILKHCVLCKKEPENGVFFDFERGGIVCGKCKGSGAHTKVISKETLLVLNAFEKLEMKDIFKVKGIKEAVKEAKAVIKDFNYYIFNKIYKAELFLAKTAD